MSNDGLIVEYMVSVSYSLAVQYNILTLPWFIVRQSSKSPKLFMRLFLDVTDEPLEIGESKGGKVVTKASIAKKILKKNIQANQKTLFDEEGQATIDGLSQKKSQEGQVRMSCFYILFITCQQPILNLPIFSIFCLIFLFLFNFSTRYIKVFD